MMISGSPSESEVVHSAISLARFLPMFWSSQLTGVTLANGDRNLVYREHRRAVHGTWPSQPLENLKVMKAMMSNAALSIARNDTATDAATRCGSGPMSEASACSPAFLGVVTLYGEHVVDAVGHYRVPVTPVAIFRSSGSSNAWHLGVDDGQNLYGDQATSLEVGVVVTGSAGLLKASSGSARHASPYRTS